jgi:hypothetical protein
MELAMKLAIAAFIISYSEFENLVDPSVTPTEWVPLKNTGVRSVAAQCRLGTDPRGAPRRNTAS